jgi:hypothetical protein
MKDVDELAPGAFLTPEKTLRADHQEHALDVQADP